MIALKNFKDISILVVGDVMLDRYILGSVNRISPEAPVPVVKASGEYTELGGCGNVVKNLRSIGVDTFSIIGLGEDDSGEEIISLIGKCMGIVTPGSETIQKVRIVTESRQTQMLRIDYEENAVQMTTDIVHNIASQIRQCYDMIIVSDYGKGMINEELMSYLKGLRTPIIVDPKPINSSCYDNVFMITPNENEYDVMMLDTPTPLVKNVQYILKTAGADGMYLQDTTTKKEVHIEAEHVDVFNVIGAGDVVVAVIAACISSGLDVVTSARISNRCGNYVVTKPGTSFIPTKIFQEIFASEVAKSLLN